MLKLISSVEKEDFLPHEDRTALSLDDLCARGLLLEKTKELEAVTAQHPLAITPALLDILNPDDPQDPIARQFIPSTDEAAEDSCALQDPVGDQKDSPLPGIIHRYPDRLLLNLSQVCPAYCRFCFRKGLVGAGKACLSPEETERALAYIREHTEIWEVILSGGEPLLLSLRRLREVFAALRTIKHVKTLRLHTRLPITRPDMITPELVRLVADQAQPVSVLIHCNHPRELAAPARAAIARLISAGIPLYSQSVLLKGVNDDLETLTTLMRAFVENRIKPHYVYHPDLVRGTKHFRLSLERGRALMQQLQERFSGLCRPHYILDIPGGGGKVSVLSDQVQKTKEGWVLKNYKGDVFLYEE